MTELKNYECDGQIDIFSFLDTCNEPPVLLQEEEPVYLVTRGDIREFTVASTYLSSGERFYTLDGKDGGHWTTRNKELGIICFTDKRKAELAAQEYIAENDVIRADAINIQCCEAYSFIDKAGERKFAFFCEMANGMAYIKNFFEYIHVEENTEKVRKKFRESMEGKELLTSFIPELKNMYRCRDNTGWKYADARYEGCV